MLNTETLPQPTALIVDDDAINRMVLCKFLEKLGYITVQCENGKIAIEEFCKNRPDIVFMDVMMPVMNGYEATRQIKYLTKNDFIPVIFLTALTDNNELSECISVGGDDFLTKPLDMPILRSKIHSMERIRDIYRKVREFNHALQNAEQLAQQVFEQAVFNKNFEIKEVETWFQKAKGFNNDIFLTASTPSNGLNFLFGHFNVEGLAAAVGALPTSEVFRAMSNKGFSPQSIVQTINAKLYDLVPKGINLSMVFISIDESLKQATVCNFNMPDILFISDRENKILHRKKSQNDTIGDTPKYSRNVDLERFVITENTHILLASPGVLNASNKSNTTFGDLEYYSSVNKGVKNGNILETIKHDLQLFFQDEPQNSNLSLIEIPCNKALIPQDTLLIEQQASGRKPEQLINHSTIKSNVFNFELQVNGLCLRSLDPVPLLLNNLESVTNIEHHQEALFTILTELFINALDHGILHMESSLKDSAEGFAQYFTIRDEKLETLEDGQIIIKLALAFDETINRLYISIVDSGPGFDITKTLNKIETAPNLFSGRGIKLVDGLCDKMEFNAKGNQVDVVYSWNPN